MSRRRFGTTIGIFLTSVMHIFCIFASRLNGDCTITNTLAALLSSRAIHQPEFIEVVTTPQTHIELYQDMDMGYLPPSFSMMELANRINKNATARVSQYGIPQANRMYGVAGYEEDDNSTTPIIQGSTRAVFQMNVDSRGRNVRHQGIKNNRYSANAPGDTRETY